MKNKNPNWVLTLVIDEKTPYTIASGFVNTVAKELKQMLLDEGISGIVTAKTEYGKIEEPIKTEDKDVRSI